MKVSFLLNIARQVEGEYVFVKVVKASTNPEKLHRFLRENNLPQTMTLGDANYVLEYGVIENVELEDTTE
jgi:hypothetical protein